MSKIPIVLITGYLGSGKTTVVNHLLGTTALAGRDVALVINEFGTLGVDGALVDADRLAKQYEINSGSLFCSCTKLQLFRSMQDIAETLRPDLVLVEATGVAEPADFLSLVSDVPNLARQFSILATLAVVDAKHFTKVAPFMRAARKQVACASGVVINKADLVPQDDIAKLQNLLAEMNSSALQVVVASGAVSMEWIE
jgi:G3E family GTPase